MAHATTIVDPLPVDGGAATSGDRARRGRRVPGVAVPRARRWSTGPLAAALGCLVLALAVPRVAASLWLATRVPVVGLLYAQVPALESELRGLIASRELALDWAGDDAGAHADIAAALMALAWMREAESPAEEALLRRAAGATAAGLALAPADPRGWFQLAYLETLLRGERPTERAAAALLASLRTGAYDRADFLAMRLRLCLLHWPLLDGDGRRRVAEQVRLVWEEGFDDLVALAAEPDFAPIILTALDPVPGAVELLLLRRFGDEAPAD